MKAKRNLPKKIEGPNSWELATFGPFCRNGLPLFMGSMKYKMQPGQHKTSIGVVGCMFYYAPKSFCPQDQVHY